MPIHPLRHIHLAVPHRYDLRQHLHFPNAPPPELLRRSAENTLMDMVCILFRRLPEFQEDAKWFTNMKKLKMRCIDQPSHKMNSGSATPPSSSHQHRQQKKHSTASRAKVKHSEKVRRRYLL